MKVSFSLVLKLYNGAYFYWSVGRYEGECLREGFIGRVGWLMGGYSDE